MPLLSKFEFEATFDHNIELAASTYNPCLDFWDYVDVLSEDEREGHVCDFVADYIFYNDARKIEHIMLRTDSTDHYLVIVLDKEMKRIIGHHLFNVDFDAKIGWSGTL